MVSLAIIIEESFHISLKCYITLCEATSHLLKLHIGCWSRWNLVLYFTATCISYQVIPRLLVHFPESEINRLDQQILLNYRSVLPKKYLRCIKRLPLSILNISQRFYVEDSIVVEVVINYCRSLIYLFIYCWKMWKLFLWKRDDTTRLVIFFNENWRSECSGGGGSGGGGFWQGILIIRFIYLPL